jgi:hypothetical protein
MEETILRILLFSSLIVSGMTTPSRAADTLGKGGNITGDETLVSAGGAFTMGFFSLGPASSKRFYLGIWFTVSPDEAICWVANHERPLLDNTGVLVVRGTGDLVLLDGGQIAWSSNSTASSSSVEAQLLDSGNLVVRDPSAGTILWQWFDYPSNTLLPGMKMGKDLWNGREWHLTSWSLADDPSSGVYTRRLDTNGLPDFVLWKGDVKTYRAGPWNGWRFGGVAEVSSYSDWVKFKVTISPGDEISYGYTVEPGAPWTRLVLTETGHVKRLVWEASTRTWQHSFEGPRDLCDDYGRCGAFSLCDMRAASSLFCPCLRGFSSDVSQSAGSQTRDTSAGCRRNVALQCSSSSGATTDGFVPVTGVKLPDTHNASVDMSITVEECERRCRANCSCVAYAAADIRGGGSGSGCVMWTDDIIDLRLVEQGQDLYLRLARSDLAGIYAGYFWGFSPSHFLFFSTICSTPSR